MTSKKEQNSNCKDLPEHWEMRVDPKTGVPYFLNHLKQFTTWDDPREVLEPRGMLNNIGTMLREQQRSLSPSPSSSRRKVNEDGSTSIPLSHFETPTKLDFEQQTCSPPKPRRQNPQRLNRGWMDDDAWFKTKFNDVTNGSDFSWLGNGRSRTLRARSQSPFPNVSKERARSTHGKNSLAQKEYAPAPKPDTVSIPIKTEPDGPCVQECVIIPTQYRRDLDGTKPEQKLTECRESPTPKQAKQEANVANHCENKSIEKEFLQRNDSVYDNNPTVDELITKTTDINANEEISVATAKPEPVEEISKSMEIDKSNDDNQNVANNKEDEATNSHEEELVEEDILAAKMQNSYKVIEKVREEIAGYRKEVEEFSGVKQCKQYRYLDEMLTRCQLKLDDVQTFGDLDLRKHRKETVNHIDSLLSSLEERCEPVL